MITQSDLESRFDYHAPPNAIVGEKHQRWRAQVKELARYANVELPDGRELALVLTNLEHALFWGNAAIARNPDG